MNMTGKRLLTALIVSLSAMLLAAPPVLAAKGANVRFVHAVPGAGDATLEVAGGGSRSAEARAGFGEASDREAGPSGEVQLSLRVGDSGDAAYTASETLVPNGDYTVVAQGTPDSLRVETYRDGDARGGVARVRMIHAAPEVGEADVVLGGKKVASDLGFGAASDYRDVTPGSYDVAVQPAGKSNEPLVSVRDLPLNAGTTSTAIVVGSAGEKLRVVPVADTSAGTPSAPGTGLGGLSEGPSAWAWLVVLAGTLLAGALGAATQRSLAGRRSGGPAGGL